MDVDLVSGDLEDDNIWVVVVIVVDLDSGGVFDVVFIVVVFTVDVVSAGVVDVDFVVFSVVVVSVIVSTKIQTKAINFFFYSFLKAFKISYSYSQCIHKHFDG